MAYIDGFVAAVPTENKAAYIEHPRWKSKKSSLKPVLLETPKNKQKFLDELRPPLIL